ncbi:hypothetical protein LTS10_007656 [Elasticomyces elasticus]|nr:hypothetical protein LTS10_007656 [Elasticomyces elasticus]
MRYARRAMCFSKTWYSPKHATPSPSPTAMISQTTKVYSEAMLDDRQAHSDPAPSPWYPMHLSTSTPTVCETRQVITHHGFGYAEEHDLQLDPQFMRTRQFSPEATATLSQTTDVVEYVRQSRIVARDSMRAPIPNSDCNALLEHYVLDSLSGLDFNAY